MKKRTINKTKLLMASMSRVYIPKKQANKFQIKKNDRSIILKLLTRDQVCTACLQPKVIQDRNLKGFSIK